MVVANVEQTVRSNEQMMQSMKRRDTAARKHESTNESPGSATDSYGI